MTAGTAPLAKQFKVVIGTAIRDWLDAVRGRHTGDVTGG